MNENLKTSSMLNFKPDVVVTTKKKMPALLPGAGSTSLEKSNIEEVRVSQPQLLHDIHEAWNWQQTWNS